MGYFYPCELEYALSKTLVGSTTYNTTFTNSSDNYESANESFTVKNATGKWRCLTSLEWKYLLEEREIAGTSRYSLTYIQVNDKAVGGVIIFPDEYTGQTSGLTEIPDGCVFLPAAGQNYGQMSPNADILIIYYAASNETIPAYSYPSGILIRWGEKAVDVHPIDPGRYSLSYAHVDGRNNACPMRLVYDL